MADPIPRNTRADEAAGHRRAEQERRANRPLFGQNMGGLRAQVDEVPRAQARQPINPFAAPRPAQARPNARHQPAQPPPRHFADAVRRAVDRPPQARQRRLAWLGDYWRELLERAERREYAASTIIGILVVAGVIAAIVLNNRPPEETDAAITPEPAAIVAAAPMIPAPPPAEVCSVDLNGVQISAIESLDDGSHAMAATFEVRAAGCAGGMIRLALWIYQAPNQPLIAPAAEPVYRTPLNQLTVQSLVTIDSADAAVVRTLALPHAQFPTAVNAPVWLTVGAQVWPEGRAAAAGSMLIEPVFFTRAE